MLRVKRKHTFTILEVVIAIGICTVCFSLLFANTSRHLQKQIKTLKQIEAERLCELSYFEILKAWHESGTFENWKPDFASTQETLFGNIERIIKLKRTHEKTSTENEKWKKLTFEVSYPEVQMRSKYPILLKHVDKKFE